LFRRHRWTRHRLKRRGAGRDADRADFCSRPFGSALCQHRPSAGPNMSKLHCELSGQHNVAGAPRFRVIFNSIPVRLKVGSNMKRLRMISIFISLCLSVFANAQTVKVSEDPESLRQILAHQPNYIATEKSLFSEGTEGRKRRMAKMGNRLAEVTEDAIVIKERDKPTIKIFPKRKEYAEVPFQDNLEFTHAPEDIAAPSGLIFKSLGREKVGNYICIKIEVSYQSEYLKDMKYLFWVAPELKGLIVKSEWSYGERHKTLMILEDISLNVDEALFRVPAGYKKIIEPEL
ncbi:MAG TPA: hypothetical protein VGJ55_07625, partial [Pyrinomonadaceae bacterium]